MGSILDTPNEREAAAAGGAAPAATAEALAGRRARLGLRLVGWVLVLHAVGFALTQLSWYCVQELRPLVGGLRFASPILDLLAALGVTWFARGRRRAAPARARVARLAAGMYWLMFGLSLILLVAGELGNLLQLWPAGLGATNWWQYTMRGLWSLNLLAALAGNLCLLAGFDVHPGWRWAAVGVLLLRTGLTALLHWTDLRLDLEPPLGQLLTLGWVLGYFAIWAVVLFLQAGAGPQAPERDPSWVPVVRQGLIHYRRALLGRILVLLAGLLALVLAALARSQDAAAAIGLAVTLAGLAMAGWSMLGIVLQQAVPAGEGLRAPARSALVLGALGLLADCTATRAGVDLLLDRGHLVGRTLGSEAGTALGAAGQLLGLVAFVALLVFLGRLARRAGRPPLAAEAGRLLGWVVALAIGLVLVQLWQWFGRPPPVLLLVLALGLLILAIVLVVRYIKLLAALEHGLGDLAAADTFD
jgi:hypothetical protein